MMRITIDTSNLDTRARALLDDIKTIEDMQNSLKAAARIYIKIPKMSNYDRTNDNYHLEIERSDITMLEAITKFLDMKRKDAIAELGAET
jgi:hypothetical protein